MDMNSDDMMVTLTMHEIHATAAHRDTSLMHTHTLNGSHLLSPLELLYLLTQEHAWHFILHEVLIT